MATMASKGAVEAAEAPAEEEVGLARAVRSVVEAPRRSPAVPPAAEEEDWIWEAAKRLWEEGAEQPPVVSFVGWLRGAGKWGAGGVLKGAS